MTMRLFCLIGIALSGIVSLIAPPYQVTAEVLAAGYLILALVDTFLFKEN